MARGWAERGLVESAFLDWLEDEGRVSFPWSMIDKITPHPSERVQEELGRLGVADMAIARTNTGTPYRPLCQRGDHGVPGAGGRLPQRTPLPWKGRGCISRTGPPWRRRKR